jgi:hypothetical protein
MGFPASPRRNKAKKPDLSIVNPFIKQSPCRISPEIFALKYFIK